MPRARRPHILVPVGRHIPWRALDHAHREAGPQGRVHLVHVTSWTEYDPFVAWGTVDGESREDYACRDFQQRLDDAGVYGVISHVRFGSPAREVALLAEDLDAELVVLEWDGPGNLRPSILHQVAEGIVRLAPCPVLVLREHPHRVEDRTRQRQQDHPERAERQAPDEPYEPAHHPGHRGTW